MFNEDDGVSKKAAEMLLKITKLKAYNEEITKQLKMDCLERIMTRIKE